MRSKKDLDSDMLKFISNMPIFRRLFIAFALTVAIPGIAIVVLGSYYINELNVRGQAVQTSFDAQNIASQQQTNLQTMNALLQNASRADLRKLEWKRARPFIVRVRCIDIF